MGLRQSRQIWAALIAALLVVTLASMQARRLMSAAESSLQRARAYENDHRPAAALVLYRAFLPLARTTQLKAEIHVHIGLCSWELQRPSDAYDAFEKALEYDPRNAIAHLKLAEMMVAAGATQSAIEHASAAIDRAGDSADAWSVLGAAYAEAGAVRLAEDALEHALRLDPQREGPALAVADLYGEQGRTAEAQRVLETATVTSDSARPWLALGRLHEQQGNEQAAEVAYRKAVAIEDSPTTNLRLAQFLEREARVDEAHAVLRKVDAMSLGSGTAAADFELLSGIAGAAAQRYSTSARLVTGSPRAALVAKMIEAEVQLDPVRARQSLREHGQELDAGSVALLDAEIALHTGKYADAAAGAQRALSLDAKSAPALYLLGEARLGLHDRVGALDAWTQALDSDAQFAPAHLALARDSLQLGDANLAARHAATVVRDEPANLAALLLYAEALAARGELDSAVGMAERAVAINTSAAEPHVLLGDLALRRQGAERAQVEFEQALRLQPDSEAALEGLIRSYSATAVSHAAVQKLESAASSAAMLEVAGRLYAAKGWHTDAQRCFAEALRREPSRGTAAQALAESYVLTGNADGALAAVAGADTVVAALIRARIAEARGDQTSAVAHYEAALRAGDRSGVAANNLAWLLAQQKTQLDRALELARTARAQSPRNAAMADTLGEVFIARHEYSDAVAAFEIALQLSAHDPNSAIRQHLASAYSYIGQPEAARRVLMSAQNAVSSAGGS